VADALIPEAGTSNPEAVVKHAKIQKAFSLFSPMGLYMDATGSPMERLSQARFSGPLLLGQSILIVLPYIISLIAITAICFAISYTVFMRQEIRSL